MFVILKSGTERLILTNSVKKSGSYECFDMVDCKKTSKYLVFCIIYFNSFLVSLIYSTKNIHIPFFSSRLSLIAALDVVFRVHFLIVTAANQKLAPVFCNWDISSGFSRL